MATWRNWAGDQRCEPAQLARPRTEDEVVDLVAAAAGRGQRVRVVGAGHSFTGLVTTEGTLVDLAGLRGVQHVDPDTGVATIAAGTTLADASTQLAAHGRTFENLGDIAVQTVAGATGTGTHGTGARSGNLSSTVVGTRFVTGDGTVVTLHDDIDADAMRAARVHLGALGVATQLQVRTVPAFTLVAPTHLPRVNPAGSSRPSSVTRWSATPSTARSSG